MKLKLLVLLLLASNCLFAQVIDPKKLDAYLDGIQSNNLGIGSLSIFRDGREVYTRDFGQMNLASNGVDISYNKYQIGSVTKMLTATLVFKLVEMGRLKLNDKLSDFYPQVPNAEKIAIKNLLEHTSGLGSYVVKDGVVWLTEKVTEKEILELIIKQGVSFQPGEKVAYSNSAFYLLARIIEQKYHMPYHKIIKREITDPLGLSDLGSFRSKPKKVFRSFHYENKKWNGVRDLDFLNVIGVGDIASSTKDLNMFSEGLFGGKILKKETLEMMLPVLGKEDWGRGIALWDFDGTRFYGHGGDTLGSHAVLIHNPQDGISIAYATNGERIRKEEFIKNIVNLVYDRPVVLPKVK